MKCSKCGEKLALFSCYCENCGAQGPTTKTWWKFIGTTATAFLKKRVWLTITLACLILLLVGVGVWQGIAHSIDLTDYIVAEASGFDGSGSIRVDIDYDALCEKVLGKVPDSSTAKGYEKHKTYMEQKESLVWSLSVSADRTSDLKNGDFYTVTVRILDSELFEELGYTLKEESYQKTFQVGKDCNALDAPVKFNLFDYIRINFSGTDTNGYVVCSDETQIASLSFASGNTVEAEIECHESWFGGYSCYVFFPETNDRVEVQLNIDKTSSLSNGDMITVTLDETDIKELNQLGVVPDCTMQTYHVSGLE